MKKLIFTLLVLFTITGKILSQNTEVEFLFGYQKHDKRFFRVSGVNTEIDENWGTTYLGININKNVFQSGKIKFDVGAGYGREINTFKTPYYHCFDNPDQPCSEVLAFIDRYSIDMLFVLFIPKINLGKNLHLNMSMVPQFYFLKNVHGYGKTSDFDLGLYSIEFNPELEYSINKINIGIGYRLFQLKAVDKVYLYKDDFLAKNPGYLEKSFDTYNPTKLILSVGYKIGSKV